MEFNDKTHNQFSYRERYLSEEIKLIKNEIKIIKKDLDDPKVFPTSSSKDGMKGILRAYTDRVSTLKKELSKTRRFLDNEYECLLADIHKIIKE